jgi:hypothetical protein
MGNHEREAFGTGRQLPDWLRARALRVGPTYCRRLAAHDAPTVERELGPLPGARRSAALLARRDRVVCESRCGEAG